jgi:hypothetical protein
VISKPSTPRLAWNPQNDVNADSFRLTLPAEQDGSTIGSADTRASTSTAHDSNSVPGISTRLPTSVPCSTTEVNPSTARSQGIRVQVAHVADDPDSAADNATVLQLTELS